MRRVCFHSSGTWEWPVPIRFWLTRSVTSLKPALTFSTSCRTRGTSAATTANCWTSFGVVPLWASRSVSISSEIVGGTAPPPTARMYLEKFFISVSGLPLVSVSLESFLEVFHFHRHIFILLVNSTYVSVVLFCFRSIWFRCSFISKAFLLWLDQYPTVIYWYH